MTMVTVLSSPERRRRWTSAQKQQIVQESLVAGACVVEIARRHDVHPNLLHLWRRQARVDGLSSRETAERGFMPVSIVAPGGDAEARIADGTSTVLIEVVLRNGRVLRFAPNMAAARMVELAAALEEYTR
jgi:transposase